tara:strand:+ start:434 stop:628 length:195 start_codon:yes stop_codon:yes gene_type:complete
LHPKQLGGDSRLGTRIELCREAARRGGRLDERRLRIGRDGPALQYSGAALRSSGAAQQIFTAPL